MIIRDDFVKTLATIKGGPVTVLLLLVRVQAPVHAAEIAAALGVHVQSVKGYLATLETYDLAAQIEGAWQVATAGRQMVLGETALPSSVGELSPASDTDTDAAGRDVKKLFTAPAIIINSINPSKGINETNNNSGRPSENFTRGLTRNDARGKQAQSPFSADDEQAIAALVTIRVPRKRAEEAVSKSPLASQIIVSQVRSWVKYTQTPAGANLSRGQAAGMFPFLVARRIADGELCPIENDSETKGYDGYVVNDD